MEGEPIISGQTVIARSRLSPPTEHKVEFRPDFGFKIGGNNLADAEVMEILKQPSTVDRIFGPLGFALYNIFK